MSYCCGGRGCTKEDAHLESREVGKLCPVDDAEYLASGPFFKKNSIGLDMIYCTGCLVKTKMVWAYLPKCWCGATIHPRDVTCGYHGHLICQCSKDIMPCPGWHDYTEKFAEK